MRAFRVPFLDLTRQERELREELLRGLSQILERGRYVLGPEVEALEREFSSFCGSGEGIGVNSGTDAIALSLRALGIGGEDEVITSALSAPPTAIAVRLAGARPVFADIDPLTLNLDPESVEERITSRTRVLLPVHLYGRPADMVRMEHIAREHDLILLEDCAQAHGASLHGKPVGTWGKAGCFSFYPTKNLGAYGDAGMVITSDPALARELRSLRDYGRADRDRVERIGVNSRLDELQAAFLRLKLRRLEAWNTRRRELARRYLEAFSDLPVGLPTPSRGEEHVYHLFVITCRERDALREHLARRGVETAVHYSLPLHRQTPFTEVENPPCPQAEHAAQCVLSLPLYPQLTDREQEEVIAAVRDFFRHRP